MSYQYNDNTGVQKKTGQDTQERGKVWMPQSKRLSEMCKYGRLLTETTLQKPSDMIWSQVVNQNVNQNVRVQNQKMILKSICAPCKASNWTQTMNLNLHSVNYRWVT